MNQNFFENIYKSAGIPVIICEDNEDMTVSFSNLEARLLLNPTLGVEMHGSESSSRVPLGQFMRWQNPNELDNIRQILKDSGSLRRHHTSVFSSGGGVISVKLSASTVEVDGRCFVVIYLLDADDNPDGERDDILAAVLSMTYHSTDINHAMQSILAKVGEHINVSRVYIFEDFSNDRIRNTYEWCAPGVAPEIDNLQNLSKDDFTQDIILNPYGLYVADDISTMPEIDRAVLEPQGIKAIAVLPLYHQNEPIGYIGYDDCRNTRKWSHRELALLKGISSIVSSLIIRRNAEADIRRGLEALQTVSDNIEPIIFVSDLDTYELKFVNRSLSEIFDAEPEQLIGKPCWQVLQKGMDGPCPFCPVHKLLEADSGSVVEWEHQNTVTGAWLWSKDSIIQWIDGNPAHFETSIDITLRKQYEKQLQHYASTDALTGVFNREWGTRLLSREYETARVNNIPMSLCFIDVDGLKNINDSHGHEAGDEAILRICNLIRNRIRREDMICRWGGDEFILLIKCEKERADAIMQGIQNDVRLKGQGEDNWLSFSYGLVNFCASESVDAAVTLADSLMYEDKKAKRASFQHNGAPENKR